MYGILFAKEWRNAFLAAFVPLAIYSIVCIWIFKLIIDNYGKPLAIVFMVFAYCGIDKVSGLFSREKKDE